MNTRIYLVTSGTDTHLVRATNKVVAINHIARKNITAAVASQMELVEMIADGAKVKDAGENDSPA